MFISLININNLFISHENSLYCAALAYEPHITRIFQRLIPEVWLAENIIMCVGRPSSLNVVCLL